MTGSASASPSLIIITHHPHSSPSLTPTHHHSPHRLLRIRELTHGPIERFNIERFEEHLVRPVGDEVVYLLGQGVAGEAEDATGIAQGTDLAGGGGAVHIGLWGVSGGGG